MPGRSNLRLVIAAVAILAAIAVGITAVWSVADSISTWSFAPVLSGLKLSRQPVRTTRKVLAVRNPRSVVIASTFGDVDVTTAKVARLHLSWSVPGRPHTALAIRQSPGYVELDFTPPDTAVMTGDEDVLDVTLPAGLAVRVDTDSGDVYSRGQYGELRATSDSGDLHVTDFRGVLSANTDSGDLDVQDAVADGQLTLASDSGDVSFSGDPGLAAGVETDSGDVDMAIRPGGRLQLQVQVDSGGVSSTLSPLASNADGTEFSGRVGQGSPGRLDIVTSSGDVSLEPWQQ